MAALTPDDILSGIRIGAAMTAAGMQPEEIATRALVIGILLDKHDAALTDRILALLASPELAALSEIVKTIVESGHAV